TEMCSEQLVCHRKLCRIATVAIRRLDQLMRLARVGRDRLVQFEVEADLGACPDHVSGELGSLRTEPSGQVFGKRSRRSGEVGMQQVRAIANLDLTTVGGELVDRFGELGLADVAPRAHHIGEDLQLNGVRHDEAAATSRSSSSWLSETLAPPSNSVSC